jgi:hypothetical protein
MDDQAVLGEFMAERGMKNGLLTWSAAGCTKVLRAVARWNRQTSNDSNQGVDKKSEDEGCFGLVRGFIHHIETKTLFQV